MEGGWWWLSQLSRFGVARSCTHSLELLKRLRKGTGLCFSVYHACRVSMYAPTTSPYGPPASLPPLPSAPPPMVSQPVYDYAPMVSQPVYDYAPMVVTLPLWVVTAMYIDSGAPQPRRGHMEPE